LGYLLQAEFTRWVSKNKFTHADDVFRELLKQTRLAKNLTQADVARRLGLPQSYVSKYETGERRLDFVETAVVCRALGLSVEEFTAAFSSRLAKSSRAKRD
jgi:transcriptional regulator with XRE-family HTH domain